MSERGSFVTEYIYCDKCLDAAWRILKGDSKYFKSFLVPGFGYMPSDFPIIAGKIGGFYPGEELHTFEFEIIPKLEAVLCHPLRIAVIGEAPNAHKIFEINKEVSS